MILNKHLEIISDDVERVCGTMHELTPFRLMMKSEGLNEYAADGAYNDGEIVDFTYESSLRQGPQNLYELGLKYYSGEGDIKVKKDTALTYFAMAGALNHVLGMVNAGMMFLIGEGTEANYAEAFYWFAMAANQKNERGLFYIADFYMTGRGIVEENHSIAAKFYTLSGAYGSEAALYNLGVLKLHGDGIEKNEDEALLLIRLAAEKGYEPAMNALKSE